MTTYKIELVIVDGRFCNSDPLINRKTIRKGSSINDELAMHEAQTICGVFDSDMFNTTHNGKKYRTWSKGRTLHQEYKYTSSLIVTFKREI